MKLMPMSLQLSEYIKTIIYEQNEWKQFCYNQVGIPESWSGPPLTNEEIEIIHMKFLLKYGLA